MIPSWAPCWPRPRGRRELTVPGQSVEVHVDYLRTRVGRLYQFTAVHEATRYRVRTIYDHAAIKPAIDFVGELRRRLPVAIQRIMVVCSWFLRGPRHAPFLLGLFGVVGGGVTFGAYEIHVGVTAVEGGLATTPFATLDDGETDGLCVDGVIGTYLH